MGRTFSESDFADKAPTQAKRRTFSESDFADAKDSLNDNRATLPDILTNEPTSGWLGSLSRGSPAIAGALAGGAAAAPWGAIGGPVGMALAGAGGAVLGGAAGESARQAAVQFTNAATNRPLTTPSEITGRVNAEGIAQGAGYLGGEMLNAGGRMAINGIKDLAPGIFKIAASIPEKSGAAAARNPSILLNSPTDKAVTEAYDAFHSASGTVSRRQAIAASDDPFDTVARAMNTMRDASNKLKQGTLTTQEAVEASQAGRIINDMKSRGVEMAQQVAEQAGGLKGQFDDFVQSGLAARPGKVAFAPDGFPLPPAEIPGKPGFPEWQKARQLAFENNVAGDFGNVFPRNPNGSPNLLATRGAGYGGAVAGAAMGGAMAGPAGAVIGGGIGGLAGLATVSPITYRTALQVAAMGGKVPAGVYRIGLSQAPASALADAYSQQGAAR